MNNKLTDLNNILFEQLERLMDDSLDDKGFEREKERSKLVTGVANAIVNNASLQLQAVKHMDEYNTGRYAKMPELLGTRPEDE